MFTPFHHMLPSPYAKWQTSSVKMHYSLIYPFSVQKVPKRELDQIQNVILLEKKERKKERSGSKQH